MKKKILAVFLSLCMAMSLLPVTALAAETTAAPIQATDTTLASGDYVLPSDIALSSGALTIAKDATVTIDLAGHTLTNAANNHTIVNNGTLTVYDSGTTGTIISNAAGHSALQNEPEAIATIESGKLYKTNNTSSNDYYVITNHGKLTINGGTIVSESSHSSAIENGWYTPSQNTGKTYAFLTINDGEVGSPNASGGLYTLKNDDYGIMEIRDGTFTNSTSGAGTVLNWNKLTIHGGNFTATTSAVATMAQGTAGNPTYDYERGTTTIFGGNFEGILGTNTQYSAAISVVLYGGTFKENVENLCATGYAATLQDGKYVVSPKDGGEMAVKPSTDDDKTSATLEGIYAGEGTTVEKPEDGAGSGTPDKAGTDVTVDLTTKNEEPAETTGTVELTVNADTAKSLVSANAEALTVKSDVGTVSLDKDALGELKDVSEPVVISIVATNEENATPTWEVTVKEGEKELFAETTDVEITITVPAPTGATADNTKVYCIDNGMEDMRAVYNKDENTLTWTTEHLSTFAALDASQEASWTTANSTSGSGTLQAALEAVDEVGGTIVVNKSATLRDANFTIKKDVTIQGTGVITATVTNEKQHAFTVAPNSTLTLDGITLKIDGNTGYGFDVQYDATLTLNNHAIVDISNISNATISSKPQDATNPGKINVNNSVITANNIRGNFSNGGVWTIGTGSEVTIDTCQSHGFSASAITVEDGATVDIKNVVYRGISINDANGKLEIRDGGVVNVTNAGTADSDAYDAVYLHENASNGLIVQEGATLNVTAGKDGNDRIELSTAAASKSVLDGTIIGTVDLPEGASHWVVTYKDNGKNWKVALVAKNSTTITLPEIPDQGYNHFVGWNDGSKTHDAGAQVTISKDTTFTAVWTYIPPANPNYRIDIPAAEGGTVTADPAAAKAGATVTLTATPDEGYAVGTITVTDRFGDAVKVTENADGTYTFTMPNGQVTVKATFVETEEPAPAEPFPDVDENDWFYDEVVYVYENGLMNGVENNQFAPNTATNRAMLATILYRLAGQPDVSGDLPFSDVAAGTWYTDAVLWAAQNGIVNGLGENTFAPMNTLTREQLVTMLYRYAEAEGYDVSAAADLSGYPDADKVQTYAQEAMTWAVAEGIVEGMDGNLNPAGNATRAQIATILMRFCEGVAK